MTHKAITVFLALVVFLLVGCIAVEMVMLATAAKECDALQIQIDKKDEIIAELTEQRDVAYAQLAEWATEDAPTMPETGAENQSSTQKIASTNEDFATDIHVPNTEDAPETPDESEEASEQLSEEPSYVAPPASYVVSDDVDLPLVNGLRSLGTFSVTHYCTCARCCGNSNGITASGRAAVAGYSIAVDPSVIPLGSTVWLDYGDGALVEYRADDTGGAVKGATIDVCVADHATALSLGRRSATVYVQEEAK